MNFSYFYILMTYQQAIAKSIVISYKDYENQKTFEVKSYDSFHQHYKISLKHINHSGFYVGFKHLRLFLEASDLLPKLYPSIQE